MIVRYVIRDNELVSREWAAALDELRRRGIYYHINEGHRTMARQQYFWGCYQCQCCNGGNLAARPTPWAPHIRTGRFDHAIDFDNASEVIRGLSQLGIHASLTVPGESWHVEANADDLRKYYNESRTDIYDHLPKHLEHDVRVFFMARNTVRNRVKDRDSVDSHKNPKKWEAADKLVTKAVERRARCRKKVEGDLKRAKKEATKKILKKALGDV